MKAIRYSCPIWIVPTCILPAIEIRLLGKFIEDFWESFSPIALKLLWESFSPIALKLRE